jgi:hypothetical protein
MLVRIGGRERIPHIVVENISYYNHYGNGYGDF